MDKEQADALVDARRRRQDIRLKCLEIAARMIGPKEPTDKETVQEFLNRYIPLSNVIELHVTGSLPGQL